MSKRKQLIHDVFERIKETSEKDTKYGWSDDLADAIEKKIKFKVSGKTLSRYYDAYIDGTNEEKGIETLILNRLSQYLGFNDYEDFCTTIEKNGENASKTTVKIGVDNDEVSSINGVPNVHVTINNTNSNNNEQVSKIPDFVRQNGMGFMEMALLICLLTGNVVFSHHKNAQNKPISFMSGIDSEALNKNYMYWDGEMYIATDSNYISPEFEVVAMDKKLFLHLRRITRKDTMTVENSLGKTWYSKYYGDVEFFTADGNDPDNKRELRKSTAFMIEKYAGKYADSIQVE